MKVQMRLLRDILLTDDSAMTTHTAEDLQQLPNRFVTACIAFGLTIRLKKRQMLGQGVDKLRSECITDYELGAVHAFVYLSSTISNTLSLDIELNKCIGKVATMLTEHTKAQVYMGCTVSTPLRRCTLARKDDLTPSTCAACGASWAAQSPRHVRSY